MRNLLLPTANNNFRAKLITTPLLVVIAVVLIVFNSGLVVLDTPQALAAINDNQLLDSHNAERKKAGLDPLTENKLLSNSALQKALAMLEHDCWDHYCPNGKSPWEFFASVDYDYIFAGENLAEGFSDIEDVMVAWMNSPTHKANVLKPEYTEVGFGIAKGTFQGRENNTVIAVHFGTPQPRDNSNVAGNIADELVSTPVISDPRSGSFVNVFELAIIGSAPDADQVTLYNNTEQLARVDVTDGVFSYRIPAVAEGEFNITAIANKGTLKSKASDLLTVTVDRSSNVLVSEDIQVSEKSANGKLTLAIVNSDLRTIRMRANGEDFLFSQSADTGLWEVEVDSFDLEQDDDLMFTTVDLAGNTWSGEINSARILEKAESIPVSSNDERPGQVLSLQTKSQINAVFLILLIALFGLDFLILALTGNTKGSAKTHLHFALLVIIGIILLTGALSGHIGEGLALN